MTVSSPSPHHIFLHPIPRRRRAFLLLTLAAPFLHRRPLSAGARGLFRMPPARLANRYFLVRAGESEYERAGVVRTNPVAKTAVDSGLSPEGAKQAASAALELKKIGACDDSCWIWPSITQRSYQAAEIIASVNDVDRRSVQPPQLIFGAYNLIRFPVFPMYELGFSRCF